LGGYGRPFWLTYLSNSLMMIAVSLLFRYADLVKFLGGTEFQLGWLVGTGMVGSLLMRILQGVGIDLYGPRRIWLWSTAGFVISALGHLFVTQVDGPLIFVLRVLFNTSIAGFFGATITYISRRAHVERMAEVIGTLGTSGFLGMIVGTGLGDLIFRTGEITRENLDAMFLIAAGLGIASFVVGWMATQGQVQPSKRKQPPIGWLLRKYQPGAVLLMGVSMGFGLGLPGAFVRPFAASLGFSGIASFFWVYAPLAFVTRLSIRRMPDRWGIRPMILLGMGALVATMLLFLTVRSQWQLAIPAFSIGIAHALLFPSVVAGATAAFPPRYRGLGTTLILAMFDLGSLIGGPLVGGLLHYAGVLELPRYPTMFLSVSVLLSIMTLYYAWASRGERPRANV